MGDAIWILIPLAPFLLAGFIFWSKHQQKMIEKQSEMTAEKAAQYAAQTERLEARVREIAAALEKKDAQSLRATKWAVRRVVEMTYDNAEDYLVRAQEALHSFGGVEARKEATRQFLDEKSFKPGLGTFDTAKIGR